MTTTGPVPTLTRGSVAVNPDTGEQMPAATHWGLGGGGRFVFRTRFDEPFNVEGAPPATVESIFVGGSAGPYDAPNVRTAIDGRTWLHARGPSNTAYNYLEASGAVRRSCDITCTVGVGTSYIGGAAHSGPVARVEENGQGGYALVVRPATSSGYSVLQLQRLSGSKGAFAGLQSVSIPISGDNVVYRVRFRLDGTHLRGKHWLEGTPEPVGWEIDIIDNSYLAGRCGMYAYLPSNRSHYLRDLKIRTQDALLIEEGTTNLLEAGASTNFTGPGNDWANNTNVTKTIEPDGRGDGAALGCTAVATAPTMSLVKVFPGVVGGQSYSFQAWSKARTVGRNFKVRLNWKDAGNITVGSATSDWVMTRTGEYVQAKFTAVAPATAVAAHLLPEWENVVAGEMQLLDHLQVEQKAYATSWQPGGTARVTETVSVPPGSDINATGSIDIYCYLRPNTVDTTQRYLFALWLNGISKILHQVLYRPSDSLLILSAQAGALGNIAGVAEGWHLVTLAWTPTTITAMVDGTLHNSVPRLNYNPTDTSSPAQIGQRLSGTSPLNSSVALVRLSSTARSLPEHVALWAGGAVVTPTMDAATLNLVHWDENEIMGVGDVPSDEAVGGIATVNQRITGVGDISSAEAWGYPDFLVHGQFFADEFVGDDRPLAEEGQWAEDHAPIGAPTASIVDGILVMSSTSPSGRSRATPIIPSDYRNVDLLAKFRLPVADGNSQFWFWLRADEWDLLSTPVNGVGAMVNGSGRVNLYRRRPTDGAVQLSNTPSGADHQDWTWIRLRAVGNVLYARVWQDGDPEPPSWTTSVALTDASDGKVGVAYRGTTSAPVGEIDEFYLADIETIYLYPVESAEAWGDQSMEMRITGAPALDAEGSELALASVNQRITDVGGVPSGEAWGGLHELNMTVGQLGDIPSGEDWGADEDDEPGSRVGFALPYRAAIEVGEPT